MKEKLLTLLIQGLFAILTPENLKVFMDAGLDAIENLVEGSENKIDDRIVLPICKLIRSTFDIPDNDEPKPEPEPEPEVQGGIGGPSS